MPLNDVTTVMPVVTGNVTTCAVEWAPGSISARRASTSVETRRTWAKPGCRTRYRPNSGPTSAERQPSRRSVPTMGAATGAVGSRTATTDTTSTDRVSLRRLVGVKI